MGRTPESAAGLWTAPCIYSTRGVKHFWVFRGPRCTRWVKENQRAEGSNGGTYHRVKPMILRPATPSDIPEILAFIRELAEYERAPASAIATEADLLRDGFGPTPRFHCLIAEGSEPASTNNEQRATNNEQRATNNEQRATNNEQRATNNE